MRQQALSLGAGALVGLAIGWRVYSATWFMDGALWRGAIAAGGFGLLVWFITLVYLRTRVS